MFLDFLVLLFRIFFVLFSIIIPIYFTNQMIKKQNLQGLKKFEAIFYCIYFALMFSAMVIFNNIISVIIFLNMIQVFSISNIIYKSNVFLSYDLLVISSLSMIGLILKIMIPKMDIAFIWILVGIGGYLLPGMSHIERKKHIVNKMKRCTKEIPAKVINIMKTNIGGVGLGHYQVAYVPKFEFSINDKNYTFMDSNEIYFTKKDYISVGEKVILLVNPNGIKFKIPNGSDDIFFPIPQNEQRHYSGIKLFYIITILLAIMIFLLRYFG